jgi:hypothetical protein
MVPVFLSWELYTPFPSILVRFILPSGNDAILILFYGEWSKQKTTKSWKYLEQVVVSFLGQL